MCLVLVEHLLKPWFGLVATAILFLLGWRLGGALVAYLVAAVLGCGLALYYLKRLFPPLAQAKVKAVYQPRPLVSFGLPVFGSGLLVLLMNQADVYFLGLLGTASDVGIYRISVLPAALIPEALAALNTILAPMISDLHHRGRLDDDLLLLRK